ncbi:HAD family hydrolase [[Enterobacter] lignolyticus]|uniref:HAD family hydrolase n=1 Tax=[Enterobacter] lignolyticus TaxID=1334193 RepID=A0A806X597_9ENTR|nr:HAD family hydrolase [[Enterobacter] lignolyticus]ALR77016.1 HAD family hydrolase [[Enterobacter] lignolyticus]
MSASLHIFDLDNTLIDGDSSTWWSEYLVREGLVDDARYLAREAALMEDYAHGSMDLHQYVALTLSPLAAMTIPEVDARVARWVDDVILPRVYPQARELIQTLNAQGQPTLVISASVSLLVKPIARALGINEAIGVEVRTRDNRYSNCISGTPSYQQGKITRFNAWRETQAAAPETVTFYTDSINDLPLCLQADKVVLVNPCPQLRAQGEARQWPAVSWSLA